MTFLEFLKPEAVFPSLKVKGKKQALQELSKKAASLIGIDEAAILKGLLTRESLSSTGIGEGIAIPHSKVPEIDRLFGLLARLDKPIDFGSVDARPVDIVFLLLAPETIGTSYLKALSKVARVLRSEETLKRLRSSHDATALYAVISDPQKPQAA